MTDSLFVLIWVVTFCNIINTVYWKAVVVLRAIECLIVRVGFYVGSKFDLPPVSQCCCFCLLAWESQGHRHALRTESVQPSSMLGKTAGDSKCMCELRGLACTE